MTTPFPWHRLRKVALDLLANPQDEAMLRSSINRSYYAAYGEAKAFAIRHGFTWDKKGQSHVKVWNYIKQGKGATANWEKLAWKAIGDAGADLKLERTAADYHATPAVVSAMAISSLSQANTIIKRLQGLP